MTAPMQVALWILIGFGATCLHLTLLRRSLAGVGRLDPSDARRRITRGLPLRLLVLSPIMLLAARSGLGACTSLIAGFLLGRCCVCHAGMRGQPPAPQGDKQG